MTKPTRDDLRRLLDSYDGAGASDALSLLTEYAVEGCAVSAPLEVVHEIGQEMAGVAVRTDMPETMQLQRLAHAAKRGAVMLLHSAWAAEQAAVPKDIAP